MKYYFDLPEIKHCTECPCCIPDRDNWNHLCGLYYAYHKKDMELGMFADKPDWCPLKIENDRVGIVGVDIAKGVDQTITIDGQMLRNIVGKKGTL